MNKRKYFFFLIILILLQVSEQDKIYGQSVEQRIQSLLEKMTLEEKIGQLVQIVGVRNIKPEYISEGRVGSLLGVKDADEADKWQRIAVEESRLGIPLIFANDIIHGFKTTFSIPLAQAASWNPELVKEAESIAAYEAASEGTNWTYAPMVDIARDPRWGRIIEGSGEDPYLGSVIAKARVEGFQGDDYSVPDKVIATAKHFVAYGAAEGGRDYNTVDMSERRLREIYLPPFKAAVDAGAGAIMSSFNDLNGIPASGNHFILTKILRDEWNFDGIVVSDFNSVGELVNHRFAKDKKEAALKGLTAGVDIDMVGDSTVGNVYAPHLKQLVEEGTLDVSVIDSSVANVLRIKFRAGLFENPYVNREYFEKNNITQEERNKVALRMARESIVLLKNENSTLPLNKDIKNIAVIGQMAENKYDQMGAWASEPQHENAVSVLEGIREILSGETNILYSNAIDPRSTSLDGLEDAINLSKNADAVIVVAGENWELDGEAASRSDISLPGNQEEIIMKLNELGVPVIVVIESGRPLTLSKLSEEVPALIQAWHLGDMSGRAIAQVLFGGYNPSGKLPVSFPRSVGQIPVYYNYKSTGRPFKKDIKWTSKYIDIPNTPLYPFGYGLSYTTFSFSPIETAQDTFSIQDNFSVSVDVTNSGEVDGDEVVQLYIQDVFASVTRPVKELKGFQKINIKAGETTNVTFEITPDMLSFYDIDMEKVVEPGWFEIMIGNSSENLVKKKIYIKK